MHACVSVRSLDGRSDEIRRRRMSHENDAGWGRRSNALNFVLGGSKRKILTKVPLDGEIETNKLNSLFFSPLRYYELVLPHVVRIIYFNYKRISAKKVGQHPIELTKHRTLKIHSTLN